MQDKNARIRRIVQIVTITIAVVVTVLLCLYIMRLYDEENMQSFEELVDSFGIWGVVFMFLLQVTYFAPFTGISLLRILLIAAVARIPSIITSTYVGSSFVQGNHLRSIVIYAVVGVLSLAGILIYNKIISAKAAKTDGKGEDGDDNK